MPKLKRLVVESKGLTVHDITDGDLKNIAPSRDDLVISLSFREDFCRFFTANVCDSVYLGDFGYELSEWYCKYRDRVFRSYVFGASKLGGLKATLQANREISRAEQDIGLVMDRQSSYPSYVRYLRKTQQESEADQFERYR